MNNLTNLTEEILLEKARAERPKLPNFEAMWERIRVEQAQAGAQAVFNSGKSSRKLVRKRLLLPTFAVSALLVAAPVVAGVSMGWTELFGRLGVKTAMESGFGNPLDITVRSVGTSLSLHGVVTDEQRLDILFTLEVPSLPDYDAVEFEHKTLTSANGKAMQLNELIRKDVSSNQLTGLFETENGLGNKREQLKLALQNLSFYKYKDLPLREAPASLKENNQIDSMSRFGALRIVSVLRENDAFTIRYEIPGTSEDQLLNPHLLLKSGDKSVKAGYSAVLPPEKANVQLRQDTFRLSDEELKIATLHFSFLDAVQTIEGTWETSFEADGEKASQVAFRKKLNSALGDPILFKKPKELIVTPLQIRVMLENNKNSPDQPYAYYDKAELILNGRTIEGGLWSTEKSGSFYRFESPEWYKDWSPVPMTLQLSEARIVKRANDRWFPLETVSESKQTIKTNLDGFPVTFTYYQQDQDLIVESQSDNPKFLGISQTAVKLDGKAIYPQPNPMPPGGAGSNKRTDLYPGVLAKQGTLQLSPGFYSYSDPERKSIIQIN